MANILFSALIADARGKFGGAVLSKNAAGNYLREFVMPVNPNTPAQAEARSIFASTSQGWRTLTEAQREAWRSYARDVEQTNVFGQRQQLSGFQLFMKLNGNLLQHGYAQIATPAGFPDFSGGNMFQWEGTGASAYINNWGADQDIPGNVFLFRFLGPVSSGRNSFQENEFGPYVNRGDITTAFPYEIADTPVAPTQTAGANIAYVVLMEILSTTTGWKSAAYIEKYVPPVA